MRIHISSRTEHGTWPTGCNGRLLVTRAAARWRRQVRGETDRRRVSRRATPSYLSIFRSGFSAFCVSCAHANALCKRISARYVVSRESREQFKRSRLSSIVCFPAGGPIFHLRASQRSCRRTNRPNERNVTADVANLAERASFGSARIVV